METNKATPRLLTAVLVLQGITLMSMWTGQPRSSDAHAAIPDPGGQREALLAEVKTTNAKLDTLVELLRSGDLKVKVENDADEK